MTHRPSQPESLVVTSPERSSLAMVAKRAIQFFFLLGVIPWIVSYFALSVVFGRNRAFLWTSESLGNLSGFLGVYYRQAFYRATLSECGKDIYIGWLSCFSLPVAKIGEGVYIGRRCSVGFAEIGDEVMLADGVQVLSGGREHGVSDDPNASHREQAQTFRKVTIGKGAWIGTNAIVMADVGAGAIIGAGAVVNKPIPPFVVAVGIPATVKKKLPSAAATTP